MSVILFIVGILNKIWQFLYTTKMPLFNTLTIGQFIILSTALYMVLDFIIDLMSNSGSSGGAKGD